MDRTLDAYCDYLSLRTLNALKRSGINTVRDLINLSGDEIIDIRGLGEKGFKEVDQLLKNIDVTVGSQYSFFVDESVDGPMDMKLMSDTLENWLNTALKPRSARALIDNFGLISGKPKKATLIADELGITRSRLGQILERSRDKLKVAIASDKIDPTIHQKLQKYAKQNTRLNDIKGVSDVYDNAAVARLYAKVTGEYEIYKNYYLKSEWLTNDTGKMDEKVGTVMAWLKSQVAFVSITDLVEQSGVQESVIRDLTQVKIKDGYIAIVNGHRKDGVNRVNLIHSVMRKNIKPMSMQEVSEQTGIDLESLRSYIYRVPGIVNVGNSIYALEEFGYSNKDSEAIAVDYLREWGTPRPMKEIVEHVLHYRVVNPDTVATAIYANPEVFTRFSNGYVALAEWGYESDAKKRAVFEVSAREAVLVVLEEATGPMSNRDILEAVKEKYGDKATSNLVTIAAATVELEKEGLLDLLGTSTYYYQIKR